MYILLWINLRRFALPKIWSAYPPTADIGAVFVVGRDARGGMPNASAGMPSMSRAPF